MARVVGMERAVRRERWRARGIEDFMFVGCRLLSVVCRLLMMAKERELGRDTNEERRGEESERGGRRICSLLSCMYVCMYVCGLDILPSKNRRPSLMFLKSI